MVGLEVAEKQRDKARFSCAIRSHHAYLLAALNDQARMIENLDAPAAKVDVNQPNQVVLSPAIDTPVIDIPLAAGTRNHESGS